MSKTIMCLFKYRNEVYILIIFNMNYKVALNRPRQFRYMYQLYSCVNEVSDSCQ